jgi:uncharacterized protein YndB with AHSA1/START domain
MPDHAPDLKDVAAFNPNDQFITGEVVRVDRLLNAPVDKVWSYVTESDKRAKWFAAGNWDLRLGGKTELIFAHHTLSGEASPPGFDKKGPFEGEIIAFEPPRLIAWRDTGIGRGGSEIRIELASEGSATHLSITHTKMGYSDRLGASAGWGAHLNILEDVLAGRKPRAFWTMHDRLRAFYAVRYPEANSALGKALAGDTFQIERLLQAPPEKVWSFLVDADKRSRWFNAGDTIRADGQAFEMHFGHHRISDEKPPAKYARFDGTKPDMVMKSRVLAFDPPRLLSYSWSEGKTPSEVTFKLTPKDGGTLLTLTHTKLASREDMLDVAGGWTLHLGLLEDEINEAPHRSFWRALDPLSVEYSDRL